MRFTFFMMPLHQPSENPALVFDCDIEPIHYADDLAYHNYAIRMAAAFDVIARCSVRRFQHFS
ncbi:MAG: hypothetical protein Q8S00_01875 [Deltaproteobacteria bacterium]|nr:hypothetical protein [Deltaproteobacteria bacterium]MDZ4347010.1 hypothetical protein [Candidatus Binatia bacterium]